jgi:Cobalamin-independent synthase, N-terminal domain
VPCPEFLQAFNVPLFDTLLFSPCHLHPSSLWLHPLFWVSPVSVRIYFQFDVKALSKFGFLSGGNREVKKAVESYWAGKITADQLTQVAADVKKSNWTSLKASGVTYVPRLVYLSFPMPRV